MTLLLFYEFRKLLMKPVFLLLVLFMAAVLLVRFYMSCGDLDYVDQALYQKVRVEVSELPYEEALAKLQRDRDGLILVTFSSMFSSSEEEQEFFSEQFAGIAEPYGMTVREMITEYESYAKDAEERQKLQTIFTTLSDQYSYIESYRAFIEELPERAAELEGISVFAHTDSYANRSIKKSLRDYLNLGTIEIRPEYDQGVKTIGSDYVSILFVFVLILGAAVILFSEEEENGLLKLLRTTRKGHEELAAAKWGTLLLCAAVFSVLIFGGQVLTAGIRLGFEDLSRSLQSVSDFRDCCYQISVGGYLLISVLLPMAAALVFASVTAFLFVLLKKPWIAAGAAALLTGLNYLFYRFLSENAALNVLKFVNLFCLSDVNSRYADYCNIDLFGYPISVLPTVLAVAAVLIIAGGAGCIIFFSKGLNLQLRLPFTLNRKVKIRGSVKTFVQEHYRLYIGAFGLIAMAVFLFIGYRKIDQDELLLSNADYLYYSYGQEIAGEITDDTVEWFQKKQEELNLEASGGITDTSGMTEEERTAAIFAARMRSREIEEKQRAVERIMDEFIYLEMARGRGIPVHYISKIQTEPVYNEGTQYLLSAMLMLAILCFVFCPVFSQDEESGIGRLVHTTKRGRDHIFFMRYLVMFLFYTAAFLLFFLPQLYHWIRTVRMSDWEAPVQSVLKYVDAEGSMTLRTFTILWICGSYVSGLGFTVLMSLLSRYCKKNSTTMIVAAVIIAADFFVTLFGFPVISSLVLSSGFAMTDLQVFGGRTWLVCVILGKNILVTAILLLWHRRVYIGS